MIPRYNKTEINKLANILINDGVISVPTDTVYGICARINSIKAYNKLIAVKNRPLTKSFPIMCADEKQIKEIGIVDKRAEKLIQKFMPGPITLVLKKNANIPDYVSNDKDTIAVRMATSQEIKKLIEMLECPIFMTSANISGMPVCTSLDEIEKECPLIDGMLEGRVNFGESSTIVDCTKEKLQILRQGPISEEQIKMIEES